MRNLRILDKVQLNKLKAKHLDAKISEHKDQAGIEYTRIETADGKVTFHHHKESVSRNIAKYKCQYLPINHTIKAEAAEEHHVEEIPTEVESVETPVAEENPETEEVAQEPAEEESGEVVGEEQEAETISEGEQISGEVTSEEGETEDLEPVAEEVEVEDAPAAEETEEVEAEPVKSKKRKRN